MSSIYQNFSFLFSAFCITFALPFINTVPVAISNDLFDQFIDFLKKNNCSMPKEVDLPFSVNVTTPFSYLSIPLEECKSPDALKENNKANLLCKEIFDVLQNITCNDYNVPLPKINSSHLSENICKDFTEIQDIIPKKNEYLSRKLGDSIICKVLCTEKYELLCKTLLWSYDTQTKIKNMLNEKITVVQSNTSPENYQEMKQIISHQEYTKNAFIGSTLSYLELVPSMTKSSIRDQTIRNKSNSLSSKKDVKLIKSNNISQEVPKEVDIQPDTQNLSQKNLHADMQPAEQSPNLLDENLDHEENSIENLSDNMKVKNHIDVNPETNVYSLTSEGKNNKNGESNTSLHTLPSEENNEDNTNSIINNKPNEKTESSIISRTEIYNDLNNIDFQEQENETKSKGKHTDSSKKTENSKESVISNEGITETDSKLLESTILPIFLDKNEAIEQHQEVKDPEQYNDSENDGDYTKQEYDNGFSPSVKKDSDVKNSIKDSSHQISSNSHIQINPESFPGHGLDVSQNYLPEQEDGHFFFYFLSIVLILMAGYLIFHNKQKIFALIIEGRHERRRRSHGAGYKKLETK